MGLSNVEVANDGLRHLGRATIASLSENNEAARQMNAVFARAVEEALAASHWTFARKIATLANVTNDWDERWAYKYDLPSDCVNFIRIVPRVDIPNTEPQAPHQILDNAVYTNELDAKAEYVYLTTDTTAMPIQFLRAVSYLLAMLTAMPLTRKMSIRDGMEKAYEKALARAVSWDSGQEPTVWDQNAGGYIEARGGAESEIEGAAPDGSIYWT